MLRFLLLTIASLLVGLVVALAAPVRRRVAQLLRMVLLGLVALLGVCGLAMVIVGLTSDADIAAFLGGAIILLSLFLGWPLAKPRRRGSSADGPDHVPLTRSPADPRWQRLESGLDWVGRKQVRRARDSIEGFIAERDSPSLTHEHQALLLSCEKRVPELIDTCLDRCRNAAAHERERYIDETLDILRRIGSEAESARRSIREADDQRLSTLRRYFENVAGPEDRGR